MNRLITLFAALLIVAASTTVLPASAADMTFQVINDTERSLNFKLFSRGDSHQQWPSKSKAYSVNPDTTVQQLKITCETGEEICWGAWLKVQRISGELKGPNGERDTHTSKYNYGAGERGQRSCARCCHVCSDGALLPVTKISDPNAAAK